MADTQIRIPCMMRGDAMASLATVARPEKSRMDKLRERRGEAVGDSSTEHGTEPGAAAGVIEPPQGVPTVLDKLFSMPDTLIERDGALAIIHINGPMSFGYDIYDYFEGGAWNQQVVAAIDQVAADPGIAAVVFKANCPGGTCAGMSDVIAACGRLRKSGKDSISVLGNEDLCSAMYWIACAVTQDSGKIVVTSTARTGSVGVVCMLYDVSEAFKQAGIRPVGATTGKEKVDGAAGLAITAEMEARYNAKNEELFTDFLGDVALARGLTEQQVRAFEGAYFYGKSALAKGLVDEIVDASTFIAQQRSVYGQGGSFKPGAQAAPISQPAPKSEIQEDSTMAEPTPAATIDELKKIFPGDGNSALASLEAKHTVAQAQAVRIEQLTRASGEAATANAAQVAAEQAKTAAAEAKAAQLATLPPVSQTPPMGNGTAPAAGAPGNHPGAGAANNSNDHQFIKGLRAYAATNKTTVGKAWAGFAAANPDLHQAYKASLPTGSPVPLSGNIGSASASL